ncbi:MAG: zinc-binding dehydrogenase [Actinomycetota bacterium]|nr:zinc-binding dehydrogenase [Actinomycetota bacterium]
MNAARMREMTAAVIRRHGGPEVLEVCRIERPEPRQGEVRIRVAACALGGLDLFVCHGMPGVKIEFPHICGGQVVGEVEAVGEDGADGAPSTDLIGRIVVVDPELPGNRMLGETAMGGLAEYVVVPAANIIPLPPDSDPVLLSTIPVGYATAHRMLFTRARLQAGETVAVLGAAGGVGVASVQLAKLAGARVIACSSSAAKLERLERLGADDLIDTSREDFGRRIWQLTDKRGADVVVDYLGRETLSASVRASGRFGRIVVCGATTGFEAPMDLRYLWARESTVIGSNGWERSDIERLVELVGRGSLQPVVHRVLPLSEVGEGFADLEQRRAFGTVVISASAPGDRLPVDASVFQESADVP